MEDYLIKEIDKIGEMLALIATRLGLGSYAVQSESLAQQMNTELTNHLNINVHELLAMSDPLEFLISERGFNDRNIESLALMMYQTIPSSDRLNAFLKGTTDYLDHKGLFSFSLHSIV